MNKGKKGFISPLFLFLLALGLGFVNNCTHEGQSLTLAEAIDNIVKPRLRVGAVIGVVLRNQRHVFSYGEKVLGGTEAPDSSTVFEIGSITKTFTTTMLADMHLKGDINLEDNGEIYLPGANVTLPGSNGTKINLTHLATHSSGIPSLPDNLEESRPNPDDPFANFTVGHMYDFLNGCTLVFPVGTQHQYSNAGVGLLGHILGLADGTSYQELLTRKILIPLGMNNTTLFLTGEQMQNLATGYDGSLNSVSTWTATDCLQGAGFIKSTLNDMFIYLEANMGLLDTPLGDAMELAHEPRVDTPWGEYCGLGWYTAYFEDGQEIINHNGATGGYYAYIGFNKNLATGVIVLCNNNYASASDQIGPEILRVLKDF